MGVVTWLCRVIHTSISTKATEELRGLKFSCWSCSRLKALPTIQLLSQQQHKAQEHGGSVGSKRHIWIRRVNRFAATPKPGPSHPLPHWILANHHKEGKWFLQREEKKTPYWRKNLLMPYWKTTPQGPVSIWLLQLAGPNLCANLTGPLKVVFN